MSRFYSISFAVLNYIRGCVLATTASNSRPDFQQELLAIRKDPEVKSLALRRAMSPEVAEDALQTAYCAVSRVANPAAIKNLRAYFCSTLIREIYRERGQLGAAATGDFTDLIDIRQGRSGVGPTAARPVPEVAAIRVLGQGWLDAFKGRGELAARVPRRSPDPARYQMTIVGVAEHLLSAILAEHADADLNAALRARYAEWFSAPGSAKNTRDQRLLRGRGDICALLKTIIERRDLNP
jgi:hypothetical protein